MSQPVFHFLRHCFRTLFNGNTFHRAKAATVITVSAKHASTSTESTINESPILKTKERRDGGNWDWLPLQTQYHAARKTIVLCHGNHCLLGFFDSRFIWI